LGTLTFTPKEPEVGTTVKLKVLVKNIGGAKAKDVDVAFYGSGDNLIETKNLAELGAGGSQNVEIEWTGFVEGENQITVRVDPDSKLSETTRDNNEITETLVGLRSDLQIDGAPIFKVGGVVKTSVRSGDTIQVEVTIMNTGTWGVNMTDVVVKLTDQTTNDVLTERISSLPTRSDAKVTFNWVARKDGTHTITVKVNPDGLIREKDLNNNEATGTMKVVTPKPPDGEFSMMTLAAIGGIIAVVAIIAAVMMMRKKSPPAPYSAPVSTPPEEPVAVVAEEVPPPGADQGRK
jgi:subtilase family serine protease